MSRCARANRFPSSIEAIARTLTSFVGVVFYLRVIYMLYMRDEIASPGSLRLDFGGQLAALLAAAGTLALGVFPGPFLAWLESTLTSL